MSIITTSDRINIMPHRQHHGVDSPHWFINFWHDAVCCGGLLGDTSVRISYTDHTKSHFTDSQHS